MSASIPPINASTQMNALVDPRWNGIIEVLVSDLGGAVRWEPDSVALQLSNRPYAGRVADLDALRLLLGRIAVPVVFDSSRATLPDAPLVEFRRRLVESGLMVDARRRAA